MTFIEVEPPYRIVAAGRGGQVQPQQDLDDLDARRPRAARTRVEVTTETEPALPTDSSWRPSRAAAAGIKRRLGKALRRLQSILEEDLDRGARATVGGL